MGEPENRLDHLRSYVTPLETTDPTAGLDDLEPLASDLEPATIVGMGEATHGTREFFRLKHRLFRILVERLGCRVFALEANFSESLEINDYVLRGEGDPEEALDGIYFWTWNTEEVLGLLEWIRSFNAGRPTDDKIRFYGFDAQFTAGPATALRTYLGRVDPAVLEEVADGLTMLAEEGLKADEGREADDPAETRVAKADRVLRTLEARFLDRRDAYVDRTSEDEWRVANRHRRTLEQAVEMQTFEGGAADGYETRDRIMAENVSWIVDYEDAETVAVWAHNGHVMTDEWQTDDGPARTMGSVLRSEYGDRYRAIGFDFGRGSFQATVATDDETYELQECTVGGPPAGSVTESFSALDCPTFAFDLDAASDDPRLDGLLGEERPFRSFGAVFYADEGPEAHYQRFALADQFDALLFVEETTRAVPLGRA